MFSFCFSLSHEVPLCCQYMHWCRDIYWIVASFLGTTLLKKMDCRVLSFQEFLIISQLGVGLSDCLLPTRWDSVFWLAPSEVFQKQSMLDHMCPVVWKKKVLFHCIVVYTSGSYSLSWSLFHQNLEALENSCDVDASVFFSIYRSVPLDQLWISMLTAIYRSFSEWYTQPVSTVKLHQFKNY